MGILQGEYSRAGKDASLSRLLTYFACVSESRIETPPKKNEYYVLFKYNQIAIAAFVII